ncbi:MAG: alpha/beta hydrolase [Desulfobacterales bacterium]
MNSALEETVFFTADDKVTLEGAFFKGSDNAAVIAHPHPVYGGNMENLVVRELAAACQARGWSTLRFNFRGTGRSEGDYDQGAKEQLDIIAAARYMQNKGAVRVDLAGYSFGAWVLAHTDTTDLPEGRILMISPPAAMMDFSQAPPCSRLSLAVTGSEDAIAPPAMVRKVMEKLNPEAGLRVIKGADHFFSNRAAELKIVIDEFLHI